MPKIGSDVPRDGLAQGVCRSCILMLWCFVIISVALLNACSEAPPDVDQLSSRAETLIQQRQRPQAAALLMQALRADPDNASLRWRLGQLYYELGSLDFAESYLTRALVLGTSPSSVMPLLAKILLAREQYDKLFNLEIPAETSFDARASVLAQQALGHALLKHFDLAELRIQDALRLAPDSEAVGVSRARILLAQGKRGQAEAQLRKLISVYPNSVDGLAALADLVRDAGNLGEAEVLYGQALQHSSLKMHLHFLRAEVRLDLGMIDGARQDASAVEEAVPDTFPAHYLRARLLLLDSRPEKALAAFEAANTLQPSHFGTLLYGGVAAYTLGRQNLAEDWLLRVWGEVPGNITARLLLGAIRFSQQRYVEAEQFLLPVAKAAPSNAMAKRLLAATLIARDRAADAVGLLGDLVALEPDNPRSQLDLSIALILSGADQRGVAKLTGLLAEHPDYRPTYEYLIAYYVRERLWDDAERWADDYVRRYPNDTKALFLKGAMLLEAGRLAAGRAVLEAVLVLEPAHADANLRLAELEVVSGNLDSASRYYQAIPSDSTDHLQALLGEAHVALLQQRIEDGTRLLEQAVAAHPLALQARMALARLLLRGNQEPRQMQRNAQRAVTVLQNDAPEGFRSDGDYLYLLAQALLVSGSLQMATQPLRELIALRPRSRQAYALYARVLMGLDDKISLEDALTQMLSIDPNDQWALLELVRLHIATERFLIAERLLDPMLANPDRPPLADLLKGLILTATDQPHRAIEHFSRAHARLSTRRTLLALSNAEADAGLLDQAIDRQKLWLKQHPNDVEVRVSLAGHQVRAGAIEEARAEYHKALELQPNHIVALNNLAWYTLDTDLARALELASRAQELRPESLEVIHTLVAAQVEAGHWRDAELTLDRALARYPTDNELLWLSAQVLYNKGARKRALDNLLRILETQPPEHEQQRVKKLSSRIEDELRADADARVR